MAESSFRTGRKRTESGRILPGSRIASTSVLLLEKTVAKEASPQFVELQVARPYPKPKHSRLLPAATIEVRLSNGRSLMVAPEFDASHLRALLAVVESA